jgi:SAM-dependent methyltransferase
MSEISGWRVFGLEPNTLAADFAREKRGLDVRQGQLPEPKLNDRYDVITMWHVLEHTPNPAVVLAEVRRLLKPDGVWILSVPVIDSLEAKMFKENWAGYDVPRHLLTFSRASLRQFIERAGFYAEENLGVVRGLASLRLSLGLWLEEKTNLGSHARMWLRWVLLPLVFVCLRLQSGRRCDVAVFIAHPFSGG